MVSELLLYCMVGLQVITLMLILFLASRGTGLILQLFEALDSRIAEAITKLINEGSIDIEPVNPIQAFIASMMQEKMREMQPRNDGGQFIDVKPNVE